MVINPNALWEEGYWQLIHRRWGQ